jgi:putative peptidoglycan lipid II flippase
MRELTPSKTNQTSSKLGENRHDLIVQRSWTWTRDKSWASTQLGEGFTLAFLFCRLSMIRRIATVGGLTLVSRVTGFMRDVVMAAVLGAGPVADAFFVAFRLPNHFRAIFAEGAFNAAFVPAYSRTLQQAGLPAARLFSDRIAAALLAMNVVILGVALVYTPWVVSLLAPGLDQDPLRYDLAVTLTRFTFPALLLVSMQTMISGELNANGRFAAAAGAPILLNICMVLTLCLAYWFPNAGFAAAWGVLIAGAAQVLLVGLDAERAGFGLRFRMPRLDRPTRRFLSALGPAIVGAGGVQLALFADTVIASYLPTGALSALYYADRINQLPIGVVGIAVGTVLLPEMSRRLAAGDVRGAALAQARGIQLGLLLTIPCAAAAVAVPDLIMRALFMRGAFTSADAAAAGATLAAYAIGLLPFVMLRSFTAPFYARGNTLIPVKAALLAAGVNVALKVILMRSLAQAGLALATSVGAWINLTLLWLFARQKGFAISGAGLRPVLKLFGAGAVLAMALYLGDLALSDALAGLSHFREEVTLTLLIVLGTAVYTAIVLLLLGLDWLLDLLRDSGARDEALVTLKNSSAEIEEESVAVS